MSSKHLHFYNAAKVLEDCELCLSAIENSQISLHGYEFFYNTFIFKINQCWELANEYFLKLDGDLQVAKEFVASLNSMRDIKSSNKDPLLIYIKEARNQLAHREDILWISSEESSIPDGLGHQINFGSSYVSQSAKLYSRCVLPSLSLNFADIYIAAKPVSHRSGEEIPVPLSCCGIKMKDNSPLNIMTYSYEFYGQNLCKLIELIRDANIKLPILK
jgi:hypothetical protein